MSLITELQAELALLDDQAIEPIERLRQALPLISKVIDEVKAEVLKDGFADTAAEIHFFKHSKPALYALQLFEMEWYHLQTNKPVGTPDMLRKFYEAELVHIIRFFQFHAFHYQYYRLKATELDPQYFLREAKPSDIPVLELIDPPPGFSTQLDHLFAKFIAYERLQFYLIDQLTVKTAKPGPKLRWTGEKVNLVELTYGIYYTRQVNEGKAELMEIMEQLAKLFDLELSADRTYRMFLDIKRRKTISPVRFIDQMAAALRQHIEDSFGIRKKNR